MADICRRRVDVGISVRGGLQTNALISSTLVAKPAERAASGRLCLTPRIFSWSWSCGSSEAGCKVSKSICIDTFLIDCTLVRHRRPNLPQLLEAPAPLQPRPRSCKTLSIVGVHQRTTTHHQTLSTRYPILPDDLHRPLLHHHRRYISALFFVPQRARPIYPVEGKTAR